MEVGGGGDSGKWLSGGDSGRWVGVTVVGEEGWRVEGGGCRVERWEGGVRGCERV